MERLHPFLRTLMGLEPEEAAELLLETLQDCSQEEADAICTEGKGLGDVTGYINDQLEDGTQYDPSLRVVVAKIVRERSA
jgi:hypothetical protein